jgi:hypothetical protein
MNAWNAFSGQNMAPYLTASGGIGTKGLNEDARCELQGPLADFSLPAPVDPRTLGLEEILGAFRDVQKDGIGLVLLGAVMRATLCHFLPATCSVYLQGTTGTFKSAFAGVLQGFWGTKFDGAHLPANFSSTGNALEKTAFLAKDALLIVDDFVARGTRQEVAKTHAAAERLLRAQGNQAGRSRMTSKAELRNAFHPRDGEAVRHSTGLAGGRHGIWQRREPWMAGRAAQHRPLHPSDRQVGADRWHLVQIRLRMGRGE